jgi:hypothetical protein
MKQALPKTPLPYVLVTVVLLILAAGIVIPMAGIVHNVPRGPDSSNLRQIAQASLIYTLDHNDRFPEATDVWDFAGQLAESAGLDMAAMWQSKLDPSCDESFDNSNTVLVPGKTHPRQIDPRFRQLKLSIAVPLGKLDTSVPATTPIAWTRGLQPDGTWAKHSPYGDEGGYVAFVGGNVVSYNNLKSNGGELLRFDGTGKTSNILDALPPGCRIGEYVPTPAEQLKWAKQSRTTSPQGR